MSLTFSVLLIVIAIAVPLIKYWRDYIAKWRCPRCGTVYPTRHGSACVDGTVCTACDRLMSAEFAELRARMRSLVTEARPVTARRTHGNPYFAKVEPLRNDVTVPHQRDDLLMSPVFVYGNAHSEAVDSERQFAGGGGNFGGAGASGGWDSGSSSSSESSCGSSDGGGSCGGGGD